jgi:putative ABC transport system permease protein
MNIRFMNIRFMNIRLWLLYAARNLRSGLKGFYILLTCLTLGVTAIAVIGSLASAIEQGLAEQGQPLLGGDVEFSLIHREATQQELAYISSKGQASYVGTLRAMASGLTQSTLVEIKAVDQAYPLYGKLALTDNIDTKSAMALRDGQYGVAVDPLLLGRLNVKVGDAIKIGSTSLKVTGVIATEPDRLSDGLVLGPRLLMSHEALKSTGLIQPGSLITWRYRVKLTEGSNLKLAKSIATEAETKYPEAGWRVRATDAAAGGAERFVERLGYFMTLVALAALVVGGAGIANAVSAFVTRRTSAIATLKCLGLPSRDIFGLYLTEIMLVGVLGIAIAMGIGALAPSLLKFFAGSILPLPVATSVQWIPLLKATLLGILVLLAFAILPLARIANIQGTHLFRNHLVEQPARRSWRWLLLSLLFLGLAAALVVLTSENQSVTLAYLAGLAGCFLILAVLAQALLYGIKLLPKPRNILLRHGVTSLYRPGAASFSIILALGLGLSLFVTLALTDRTISNELRAGIPEKAPAFFFLDVRNEELPAFRAALQKQEGVTTIGNAPMLRGRITEVKGVAADKVVPKPGAAWALRGDRGLTYSVELPAGSELVAGNWWPKDYQGPALVSLVDEIADGLDLKIGDKLKVNVLGREMQVEVANLRRVNWRSMGINFVMVFNPGSLQAAPHSHVVTVEMEGGDEAKLLNTMAVEFPSAAAVRVKEALATVGQLLGQMLAAVRGANGLTLLTGILVLAGAMASGLATRSYESVILKTHGATRGQLLLAFMVEYGLLGLVSAVFGVLSGTLGAWYLAKFIMEMPFSFSMPLAALTAVMAMVLCIGAGLLVTARALSVRPSVYLRNE